MRCSPLDQVEKVQDLTEILELLKEPKSKMLDLLDAICEQSFSSELWYSGSVRMGCPSHPDSPHLIPLERLEFLEAEPGEQGGGGAEEEQELGGEEDSEELGDRGDD